MARKKFEIGKENARRQSASQNDAEVSRRAGLVRVAGGFGTGAGGFGTGAGGFLTGSGELLTGW